MPKKAKVKNPIKIVLFILIFIIAIFLFLKYSGNTNTPVSVDIKHDNLMILVNNENKIPDVYTVNLVEYKNKKVADIIINDLSNMDNAMRKENIKLVINTAYRSDKEQEKILIDRISKYKKEGLSTKKAEEKAKTEVQSPGYSEHATGLALDLTNNESYDKKQILWNWLEDNAHKFGFIKRYPEDKQAITKIVEEKWHFRYVGIEVATKIKEQNLCLEEYLNKN